MFVFPIRTDWMIAPSGRNWKGVGVGLDIVSVCWSIKAQNISCACTLSRKKLFKIEERILRRRIVEDERRERDEKVQLLLVWMDVIKVGQCENRLMSTRWG